MFAEYGYHGVSIEDLGAACGISGPAVYKHFSSKDALLAQKARGLSRQLVGFTIEDRAIARHGYPVVDRGAGVTLGTVTSGGPGISVPGSIGLAYVPSTHAAAGTALTIDCRGKDVAATVVKGKFYTRRPVL